MPEDSSANEEDFAPNAERLASLHVTHGRAALRLLRKQQGENEATARFVRYSSAEWAHMTTADPSAFHRFGPEPLLILHRQWLWAEYQRAWSIVAIEKRSTRRAFTPDPYGELLEPYSTGLTMRYALLYSVIEASRKGRVVWPQPLRAEIKAIESALRETRNGLFHAPHNYWDRRYTEFFNDDDNPYRMLRVHGA